MRLVLPAGNLDIPDDEYVSKLNSFVFGFCGVLSKMNIKYVLISGYVFILFGRRRLTEDIDIFIEKISGEDYEKLLTEMEKNGFICTSTSDYEELSNSNIWFSNEKYGFPHPHMQTSFPKDELEAYCLNNSLGILVNNNKLFISELESQIAFKLKRFKDGKMDKDIEDAVFLYRLLKNKSIINIERLKNWISKFGVKDVYDKYLTNI